MDAPGPRASAPEAQHLPDLAESQPNELLLPPRPESPSLSSDLDEALLLVPEHPRPPRKPVLSPTLISDTLNCELEVLFVHTLREKRTKNEDP